MGHRFSPWNFKGIICPSGNFGSSFSGSNYRGFRKKG